MIWPSPEPKAMLDADMAMRLAVISRFMIFNLSEMIGKKSNFRKFTKY